MRMREHFIGRSATRPLCALRLLICAPEAGTSRGWLVCGVPDLSAGVAGSLWDLLRDRLLDGGD